MIIQFNTKAVNLYYRFLKFTVGFGNLYRKALVFPKMGVIFAALWRGSSAG